METKKIHKYDLGIVGNCSFIALIDKRAAVKWMCMPRFDSSFLFGGLLDAENGGRFEIIPKGNDFDTKQYYIDNTNILCTEFTTALGSFRVIDFAPRFYQYDRYFKPLMLFRKIEILSGRPVIKVICKPVYNYGKVTPEIATGSNHIRYLNFESQVRLTTNISLNDIVHESEFVLSNNKYMAFSYGAPLEAALEETSEIFFQRTKQYWTDWIKTSFIPDFYQKEIIRSVLTLKLHQYEDTGGIIASASTSLSEFDQSGRNWDYRYCWMRDTYYTLNAFNNIGHFEELEKYFQYIENIISSATQRIQPLYSVSGEKIITEQVLDLPGYLNNKPVRIGNDAYTHIQNDVYGQVMVSLLPVFIDKRLNIDEKYKSKSLVKFLLDQIEKTIHEPDAGIWEFRNRKQFHAYTYLFHWAGGKSGMKIGEYLKDEDIYKRSVNITQQAIIMLEKCYDYSQSAYTQAVGVPHMDASTLQLITMNYLNHDSEKTYKHLLAIEKDLCANNGLIYRYKHNDDFGEPETTFLVCAFWYVEALACVGRIDDAIENFEKLIQFSNHLGLFSEDVSTNGSQWGNFPQTYSHVGLINAAFRIHKKLDSPLFL